MTNLHTHYEKPTIFPPFGLSDHSTVVALPKTRVKGSKNTKYVLKRDARPCRKAELGRYLGSIDWPLLFTSLEHCEDLLNVYQEIIHVGLDNLIPVKRVRTNTSDAPWMTSELKTLILKRQSAFHKHGANSIQYKFYRNVVNRKRKLCKANFYQSKVSHVKEKDPKVWWREVKRLSGIHTHSGDLLAHVNVEGIENLPLFDLSNVINEALLEPLEEYRLPSTLEPLPLEENTPSCISRSYRRTSSQVIVKT